MKRVIALALCIGLMGCSPKPEADNKNEGKSGKPEPTTFPELGAARLIQPGIKFQEATLQRAGVPMKVWYYQPEKVDGKLSLVLVPPAGSTLFVGMDLGEGDRAEHYPYVRAGFSVVSFEIDGHVPNLQTAGDAVVIRGVKAFRDAKAGLDNAATALDFILAKVPAIDRERIYVGGHSSAATLALLIAEHEPRIKACAGYAPVTDVEKRLAPVIGSLDGAIPGFRKFILSSSPTTHADKLKCPVFLFHSQNDGTVPSSESTNFAAQLRRNNANVTLITPPQGDHYRSMINEGIPKGIEWLRKLENASPKKDSPPGGPN